MNKIKLGSFELKLGSLGVLVLALVAVGSLVSAISMYVRVRQYEREHGVSVLSASVSAPAEQSEAGKVAKAESGSAIGRADSDQQTRPAAESAKPEPEAKLAEMKVIDACNRSDNRVAVHLSERPDMTAISRYVRVDALNSGAVSVVYTAAYDYRKHDFVPTLVVTGDFAYRTNVTLTVRKGLPLYGKEGDPTAAGALAEDFTYTFQRKDADPYVRFANGGRYLPPVGERTIAVENVNVDKVQAEIRRVGYDNVIQLLAREECRYKRYYGGQADSKDTLELSGEPERLVHESHGAPNAKDVWRVPVRVMDGGPSNGVYLVAIGKAGKSFCEDDNVHWNEDYDRWEMDPNYNPAAEYRLVCVSDLGLSVRTNANDVGVWVTSLSSGRPVVSAKVDVYSASNVRIMSGVTDSRGWTKPMRVAKGEPFAVVVRSQSGDDMTFLALADRMLVDEMHSDGNRGDFLKPEECTGYVWTERGIYRHGERIFAQLLLRDGRLRAPKPFPVTLRLLNPNGAVYASMTALPDASGALNYEGFAVPDDQPSGEWTIEARMPGKNGKLLAERSVKIEEFAPPQIRVLVEPAKTGSPVEFGFDVAAEHLFGGPASRLVCEGAVVFEDVPFAPAEWKGYHFGNAFRGLRPCFRRLKEQILDADGKTHFSAPIWKDAGMPKAMVRATGQGVVFEDGGRSATARGVSLLHYYPYYIGSTMSEWLRVPQSGRPKIKVACVQPNGKRDTQPHQLSVSLMRIDSVYSYQRGRDGSNSWRCERVRSMACDDWSVTTLANADTEVELPLSVAGDYEVSVTDAQTGVSFGRSFYLSSWGDSEIRAPMANPTKVTIRADKQSYRVGESPRLIVKSPFAGAAMVNVYRDGERYTEILQLTNATSEVTLRPVTREDAPNLDVYFSVVQSVSENSQHLAACAHGQTTLKVRPSEFEIPVKLTAKLNELKSVEVAVDAPNAEAVMVTLVDEGINLLTGEAVPDPVDALAEVRSATHPLFDIFGNVLPVDGEALKKSGVKTGGGFGAEMLGRTSPVGSRRFKPLAKWAAAKRGADGQWHATIELPPFVGEVRITAVAHSAIAAGAAAIQQKVTPKIVMQPDAPRFVAPGDSFEVTMPLHNRSGAEARIDYEILADGLPVSAVSWLQLPKDGATNLYESITAPAKPGEMKLTYRVRFGDEKQEQVIDLPIRPAVAWQESAGVRRSSEPVDPASQPRGAFDRYCEREFDSPLGEYEAALRWLAEYRHGCLEQTCSRILPLLAAGGVLNGIVTNGAETVEKGVRRVESMVRENDFVMWPDCDYAPWNREVSVYAAHLLVLAERSGIKVNERAVSAVSKLLVKWSKADEPEIAAYALMVLAQAGGPDKDRMFSFYDERTQLSPLARARLSLAFSSIGDLPRAQALLAESFEPESVKEAAFQVMARVASDVNDPRILPLIAWLNQRRDRAKLSWGTTEENAHALWAIGTYFQACPPKAGEKFVAWRLLSLPKPEEVKDESSGLFLSRRFLTPEGEVVDPMNLKCGQLLFSELTITSAVTRVVNDLVIEDLFAGAFDPVHRELAAFVPDAAATNLVSDWVMRKDARDDRMLIFSKAFKLEAGHAAQVRYPVRVVSAGDFVLPGPSVEGMYNPCLHARRAPGRTVVGH